MSAATTAALPSVMRTTSRRQQSYTSSTSERPPRTPSSSLRTPTTPGDSHRPESQSHSRRLSASQQASLAGVAQRDYENSNLARPVSSRRSTSRDRAHTTGPPSGRTESERGSHRQSSRSGPQRYSTDMPPPAASGAQGLPPGQGRPYADAAGQAAPQPKRRTTIATQTGEWSLGKTIGAGSMGKVKIAKNLETGEQCAIKIVPRQSQDEHHSQRDRERADHSKEVRTAREAAIVTLLNHPYICGMRDVVRTNYHWYMLFEYVNGGQMLDYIISHGRLKEKQARKFARQIVSALDYCHRNSIVHRDLKIENILISKTGDIKIIDFGLSNLFAPKNFLKTFCGSLYFAAPELLQARQYTGPEVDVWSFGIVLYVLVCGKVPFDDQSMPQLHAKIKKGLVDYPGWLSAECKNLISRMLVTDPKQRASLAEIMSHPWMTKGFGAPPENYLPHREPLQLPLDHSVVEKMTGFDFGSSEYITKELTKVLESEDYQNAIRLNARENSTSNAPGSEKKRGVFDFYKRRNSTTSRDTLVNVSAEAVHLGSDPVNAFSPLLSIYFLVREKQERERQEANPGALSMPKLEKPLKMPDLPAPEAAYTNAGAYEMAGEKPTGGRSRPRARTHGEDEIADDLKKLEVNTSGGQASPGPATAPMASHSAKKESVAGGILRRFSTRRTKDHHRERVETQQTPSLQLQPPADTATAPRKSFSVRRSRPKGDSLSPMIHSAGSQTHQAQLLTPPISAGVVSRAGSKLLGRSASVNSGENRRRQPSRENSKTQPGTPIGEPPLTSGSDRSVAAGPKVRISEPAPPEQTPTSTARGSSLRTKSLGHARRESIQARRARRGEMGQSNVPEETDQDIAEDSIDPGAESQSEMKPVFLKGLFSVSTTSSKPLAFIRADIIRVLRQLGVEYTEIKGGFSCRHAPSIDLNQVNENSPSSPEQGFMSPAHRRRISFGGFKSNDREEIRESEKSPQAVKTPTRRRGPNTSFTASEDSEDEVHRRITDRTAGETTTHVESDLGENMVLKFEIFIVKVPLFSLHGIQFKKVAGGTWQYKNQAQKILDGLRL